MKTAEEIIAELGLEPLPGEGGFYRETYRSPLKVTATSIGGEPESPRAAGSTSRAWLGERAAATAIYYLLTSETHSALHVLPCDEVFHFYLGDPVEMLQLYPDGRGETIVLGGDLSQGESPQVVVQAGTWQGSRLADGGIFALMGTTVAPGFELADIRLSDVSDLVAHYPDWQAEIEGLAPKR